ncbi:uroporphyrinogen-III synthase [Paenalkalicoccus suaedae]|uniref:Uroporphyrinogen-III synthase n=1 Tax=Paenalkalicoccus suaedae TaxID=2592382 RepID=A0A859FGD5_9BACI|nr:uroporphyrinogen-III synthase [Paenalkalicoccus suaedae]QKS71880.1 uroporphyrinogen-III synthase [Paenalkalicoccus suaedae]
MSLQGRHVLNTRARHQATTLTNKLESYGAVSIEVPLITIKQAYNETDIRAGLSCDWIVFTSVNSYTFLMKAMQEFSIPKESLSQMHIAAVGKKTKQLLEAEGLHVAIMPSEYHAEALVCAMKPALGDVFYPRSKVARKTLTEGLRAQGKLVVEAILYETVTNESVQAELSLALPKIDTVIFASPSAVRAFKELAGGDALQDKLVGAIGHITEQALQGIAVKALVTPHESTIESLLEEIHVKVGDICD